MIDVSDLVVDPDFATTFSVSRSTQTVNASGLTVVSTTTLTGVGVVVAEGNPLVLEAEYTHAQDSITIYTQMQLLDPTTGYAADKISWNGNTYLVRQVSNYSQFGYYQANCDMQNLTSAAS